MNKKIALRQQLELFDLTSRSPVPEPSQPSKASPEFSRTEGEDEELTALARQLMVDLNLPALATKVSVVWNFRLRTTAGRAFCKSQTVELNPALWSISEEEIDRTFRHELAHLVAYARAGNRQIEPHGSEWRRACSDLGIHGEERCHDLPFERRRQRRKFAYTCPNCQRELRRVRRIRKAAACYFCCLQFNRGRYHAKYQLQERRLETED